MFNYSYLYLIFAVVFIIVLFTRYLKKENNLIIRAKRKTSEEINLVGAKIKRATGKRLGKMHRRLSNLSLKDRHKSPVYNYLSFMSTTLSCLNLSGITNPETVFIMIGIVSIILGFLLTVGLPIVLFVLASLVIDITIHAILSFMAHTRAMHRMMCIMDVEDLLGSNMEDGVLHSVVNNMSSIDPMIRPIFEEFVQSVNYGYTMDNALLILNMKLGPMMDSFCENALIHYKDNNEVTLNAFKDAIKKNSKRRILLTKQQALYRNSILYYFVGIAFTFICCIFCAVSLAGGIGYFTTYHGRILTVLSIVFGIMGFVVSQIIYSGGVD